MNYSLKKVSSLLKKRLVVQYTYARIKELFRKLSFRNDHKQQRNEQNHVKCDIFSFAKQTIAFNATYLQFINVNNL